MNKSESIKNIAMAMAKFQSEVKNPNSTATNPHFHNKYAPLNEILNDVRPLLTKHGLSIVQFPSGDGDKVSMATLLMHESGEWIESDPIVLKADRPTAQGAGSGITYARRYSISAILGISSEDDDDGNGAVKQTKQKPASAPKKQEKPTDKISPEQLTRLFTIANGKTDIAKAIIGQCGYKSSKDITKADYDMVCSLIIAEVTKS